MARAPVVIPSWHVKFRERGHVSDVAVQAVNDAG